MASALALSRLLSWYVQCIRSHSSCPVPPRPVQLRRLLSFDGEAVVEWDGLMLAEAPGGGDERESPCESAGAPSGGAELYLVEAKQSLQQGHVENIKRRVELTRQFIAGTGEFFQSKRHRRNAHNLHIGQKAFFQGLATRKVHVVVGGPNVLTNMREDVLNAGYICAHLEGANYSFTRSKP